MSYTEDKWLNSMSFLPSNNKELKNKKTKNKEKILFHAAYIQTEEKQKQLPLSTQPPPQTNNIIKLIIMPILTSPKSF